jgi:heavy metal sensor kinase
MRSIRVSLLVYFLGLVIVALGATSLMVYRSTQTTLRDKEGAMAGLIQAKYEERQREEKSRFDDSLLAKANSLAWRSAVTIHVEKLLVYPCSSMLLGTAGACSGPNAFATLPGCWALGTRVKFADELTKMQAVDIQIMKSDLYLPPEVAAGEFYQVDTNYRGVPLRSKSLGSESFADIPEFGDDDKLRWEFDDYDVKSGQVARRVRLKVASRRPDTAWPASFRLRPRPGPRLNNRLRPIGVWDYPSLVVYVQYAAEPTALDQALAGLRASRDADLDALSGQTALALARQRNGLLAISTTTFLATILGACWLVWAGLSPLRRLSDAVSRVSEKDFRLPLGDAPMPAELRPIVDRLSETLDQLKRAFSREKQSTADISHELRTPLAAMMTTLELALRKPRTADKYREMIEDCQSSAQHMNRIVERLLALARLDAGVDRLRPQTIDVAELAQQCAGVVRPLAESQGLSLACPASPGGTAQVHTDPDKLREIINNLLHNAVQYNRPDGTIELTVESDPSHVQVRIRDTGIGISPEVRDRIFERFFRADPSRSGDGMNAGLGLSIVKEYVELMGGRISVESVVGQGSTFRVQLPVRPSAVAAA